MKRVIFTLTMAMIAVIAAGCENNLGDNGATTTPSSAQEVPGVHAISEMAEDMIEASQNVSTDHTPEEIADNIEEALK